jgi:hypothetical protein
VTTKSILTGEPCFAIQCWRDVRNQLKLHAKQHVRRSSAGVTYVSGDTLCKHGAMDYTSETNSEIDCVHVTYSNSCCSTSDEINGFTFKSTWLVGQRVCFFVLVRQHPGSIIRRATFGNLSQPSLSLHGAVEGTAICEQCMTKFPRLWDSAENATVHTQFPSSSVFVMFVTSVGQSAPVDILLHWSHDWWGNTPRDNTLKQRKTTDDRS